MMNQELGYIIKEKRLELGITQEELAKELGVKPSTISSWENNRTLPKIELLTPICEILDIKMHELFNEEDSYAKLKIKTLQDNKRKSLITFIFGILSCIYFIALEIVMYIYNGTTRLPSAIWIMLLIYVMLSELYFRIYNKK